MKAVALAVLFAGVALPAIHQPAPVNRTPMRANLAYWIFSEPDQPQPEIPSAVDVQLTTTITMDGVTIYQQYDNYTVPLQSANPRDGGPQVAAWVEPVVTNAAVAVGASAGWYAGIAAGGAVMGAVPVGASVSTYAAAIGVGVALPWVGLAMGAAGAAY